MVWETVEMEVKVKVDLVMEAMVEVDFVRRLFCIERSIGHQHI